MATQEQRLEQSQMAMERLRRRYPTEAGALMNFLENDDSGWALDERDKELINVALAIASRSQWGIPFHVMHAVRAGASREEILEAGFLAAVMRGQPSLPDLVPLMRALDEFSDR
jgi:AhpD family alkylhydroperoxidase